MECGIPSLFWVKAENYCVFIPHTPGLKQHCICFA